MAIEGEGDWTELARQLYEEAVFAGESTALERGERQLDAVEADLLLARGRLVHTRQRQDAVEEQDGPTALELFERSAQLAAKLNDPARRADALVWIGIARQMSGPDQDAAVAALEHGAALAEHAGTPLVLSHALRHLGIAAHASGDLDGAHQHLTESTRLREEIGFAAGVAANLVGLAYAAAVLATVVQAREHV